MSAAIATKKQPDGVITKGSTPRSRTQKIVDAVRFSQSVRAHIYEMAEPRMVAVFFEVAAHGEIGYQDLMSRLDISQPVVSRIVKKLSDGWAPEPGRPEREGLRLLERFGSPTDERAKRCRLSARGKAALDKVLQEM